MAESDDAIAQLQQQYDTLYGHVDDVLSGAAGLSDSGQQEFFSDLKQSHTTLIDAIANRLKGDDAVWTHIAQVAQTTQASLDRAMQDISKLSDNLNVVTNAVSTVAQAVLVLG